MRAIAFIASFSLLAAAPSARADAAAPVGEGEAEALFRAANDLCVRGSTAECVAQYEELIAAGYGGADLYYNLGTAELRQGKVGHAVLHLERALRFDPNDTDARANLERAQRMRVDRLVGTPAESGGEEPFYARIAAHTRRDLWASALLVFWIGGWLLLLTRRYWRSRGLRVGVLASGLGALAAAAPCAVVTAAQYYALAQAHEAVVVSAALPVREGPDPDLTTRFEIHEGLKVRVLDQEGGFKRVRLANGLQGWVPADGVAAIDG